ncbi:MAG: Tfp pilus assembly protein, major pilin PilA [Microgenomates group bacterium GW2011_GWC1_43_13]|uniref:Type II secretion system protein G n=3 Tax=Candidatus Woeseibacteriota TaxID=1752722 RepID=A0A837ICS2_9BACT|nr:MAG: Tfp pilus assembly protein, major pilin PilA [Microgenomates group bacterium GW2011_GWC1_43_13]KKT32566.1 MAG: Type II secretion system protein G [Candidatus Woesebacteria bacterium GW2011_GWB1_44_11]KKT54285.1 MAG: Type II secretion system protein G [Candidatus Woesebacteria bacterium GW2011_GWA1_44_23]OGM76666.1 MAG: hypothetical protein A2208_03095 [Candidatus Woesebacteria bacterium RIFOXYA1_FULL_43_16]OGM83161.1 MAG: hypothetical protein A2394_02650 [Candidatus Woesebacteria bacter
MNPIIKNIQSRKGFTLIELLVVISIIGILAALSTASYTSAQKQARDTTRKSDLAQYRTALESYANKNNGLYPSYPSRISPNDATFCAYIMESGTTCPGDPKSTDENYYYSYISDGTGGAAAATKYVLWAKLETVTNNWAVCSDGRSGKTATWPVDSTCPPFVQTGPVPGLE